MLSVKDLFNETMKETNKYNLIYVNQTNYF